MELFDNDDHVYGIIYENITKRIGKDRRKR